MFSQSYTTITEPMSSIVNHPEPTESDNSFDFPSSTDEHHPSPETDTLTDRYPSRDGWLPDKVIIEEGGTVVYNCSNYDVSCTVYQLE